MPWQARVQRNAGPAPRREKNPENGENSHHSQFASSAARHHRRIDCPSLASANCLADPLVHLPTRVLGNRTRVGAEAGPNPTQSRKEEYTLWAQVLTKARSSLEIFERIRPA
jgi:hypothetical protein